jgi:hypothetical protein
MAARDYSDVFHTMDPEERRDALAALILKEYDPGNNVPASLSAGDRQWRLTDIDRRIQRISPPLLTQDNHPSNDASLPKIITNLHYYIYGLHLGVLRALMPTFFAPCLSSSRLINDPMWEWNVGFQARVFRAMGWEPLPDEDSEEEDQEDDISEDEMQADSDNEGSDSDNEGSE